MGNALCCIWQCPGIEGKKPLLSHVVLNSILLFISTLLIQICVILQAGDLTIEKTTSPKIKPREADLVFGKTTSDHMLIINWSVGEGWEKPQITPYGPLSIPPSASVLHYGLEVRII